MRQIVITLIAALAAVGVRAADGDLFPYPVPSDDMVTLHERCDYLVTNFWKRCDFKSAMSKRNALNECFGDWVSFMPYANADTVHASIDRLLAAVKKHPKAMLALAQMAEGWTYSDTCEIYSEEIYLPFAKAVAENGKIAGIDRMRFENHVRIIENSAKGAKIKHLDYETRDGYKCSIDSVHTQMTVIMFNHHDCDDCTLARVRLSADYNANKLISAGLLTILCLEPDAATDEWRTAVATYPDNWVVGASEDADEYFNLRKSPSIFLVDSRHKVLAKDFAIDGLLNALSALRINSGI